MSSTAKSPEKAAAFEKKYGVVLDPDYPHLSYGADAKRSLIAKAMIGKKGIERVSFLPVVIDKQLRPEVLRSGDARFQDALRFMDWVSEDFDHQFNVEGDAVLITSRK
jgi:poly-gamma-glutamate synthesis protein (capsule biosynthesis protein)